MRPEVVIDAAARGRPWARLLVRIISIVWPAVSGLVDYRSGELFGPRDKLRRSLFHAPITHQYQERIEEMCEILEQGLRPLPSAVKPQRPFNNIVLFACHSSGDYEVNGYAVRTAQIFHALRDAGIKVAGQTRPGYPWDVLGGKMPDAPELGTFQGLQFEHFPAPGVSIQGREWDYIEAYARRLEIRASALGATVIHAHSAYHNGLAAVLAARRLGLRSVYEVRGLWHLTRAVSEPGYAGSDHFLYYEAMEISAANSADCVITLGEQMKRWLVERGVDECKILLVPNCSRQLDLEPPSAQRQEKGLVIGFIGSITPYEGLDDLVAAVALLKSRGQVVKLVVAGRSNPLVRELKRKVVALDVEDCVSFIGPLQGDAISDFYRRVDITAVVRKKNALTEMVPPLKLVESMAHGVPVLVTDLAPLREIVGPDLEAYIVPGFGGEAIADKLSELVCAGRAPLDYAALATDRSRRSFGWNDHAGTYMSAYCGDNTRSMVWAR